MAYTKAFQEAARHMASNGELRIYVAVGDHCRNPPKIGSGVIDSDEGRVFVSQRIVNQLRQIGLMARGDGGYFEVATDASMPLLRAIGAGRDVMIL